MWEENVLDIRSNTDMALYIYQWCQSKKEMNSRKDCRIFYKIDNRTVESIVRY